jgi:beta-hydroxyacyl-ACP dehydratase FabZ
MDIEAILKVLPHRYPMLLVDRILSVEPGNRCTGLKNVTMNEAFFQGHYPGRPIMPGVLIVEAMAQAGAVILLTEPRFSGMAPVIGAMESVRFRKPVVPGDTLISEVRLLKLRGVIGKLSATGTVNEEIVAEMEMTFKLVPQEE